VDQRLYRHGCGKARAYVKVRVWIEIVSSPSCASMNRS
jgi:hypothetical protein